jgi:4-oxalocrotonate tautomerase
MPTLILKVAPLQNPDRYHALAHALTDLTVDLLGKKREVTAVLVENLPAAQWHIGAAPVTQPTALLEISITEGTNTAEEKAAFIAAAFAELQRQLAAGGALARASYVIVRELPAENWGYAGITQLARRQPQATALVSA